MKKGIVYVLMDTATNRFKVGCTTLKDNRKGHRLRDTYCANPDAVLMGFAVFEDRDIAHKYEKMIHYSLRDDHNWKRIYNLYGTSTEWFYKDGGTFSDILAIMEDCGITEVFNNRDYERGMF